MHGLIDSVGKPNQAHVRLVPSATVTVDGTGNTLTNTSEWRVVFLQLDVTSTGTTSGDLLNVFAQTLTPAGWLDVYRFSEIAGDDGAQRFFGKVVWDNSLTEFDTAADLDPGAARGLIGDSFRCRWTVENEGPFLIFSGVGPFTATGIVADGFTAGDSPFDLSVAESTELEITITDDGDDDAVVAHATRPSGGEWSADVGSIQRASFTFSVHANFA